MVVLSIICEKCKYVCNAMHFQRNFKNWTSGNNDIDKFIQKSQLLAAHDNASKALEWVPYGRFYDIKYAAKGGFGKVYKANWIDGYMIGWDCINQNWERGYQNTFVILKELNNSKNITLEFINKVCVNLLFNEILKILIFINVLLYL